MRFTVIIDARKLGELTKSSRDLSYLNYWSGYPNCQQPELANQLNTEYVHFGCACVAYSAVHLMMLTIKTLPASGVPRYLDRCAT